ncbi:Pfam:aPHC [Seminavis robusta]|uniref:Pfam:aPHC n=1 Tax=Seminavis robusta TaxID=568900 RepID=A0A9N8HWB4_9STRA|nr:Pfam:aPHC [Seminavis robusta]|eukprot:Sro1947_g307160.1 Pfam:aPHC (326) ;mRNA; r:12173-13150
MITVASALCTSVISTAVLLVVASTGWQSFKPISEDCHENYLTEPNCFCERPRGEEPGDVWFAQPANTASNSAFVVIGLLIALSCDLKLPGQCWEKENGFTSSRGYGILLSCVVCLMGPGSAALHASLTVMGRRVDQFCMYLIGAFLMPYSATRKRRNFSFKTFVALYAAINLPLLILTILSPNTGVKRLMFTLLLVMTIVIEAWHKILGPLYQKRILCESGCAVKDTANGWYMVAALGCVLLAVAIWIPSKSGGPLCFPDSWFQGHAVWHVLTACSIGFIFLYGISADETPDLPLLGEVPQAEPPSDFKECDLSVTGSTSIVVEA